VVFSLFGLNDWFRLDYFYWCRFLLTGEFTSTEYCSGVRRIEGTKFSPSFSLYCLARADLAEGFVQSLS
jgi:hypothetical protein